MSNPLRVIIVEDSEDDTLLILRELRRGGYTIAHQQVINDEELTAALTQQEWDLVIADYSLPRFSAPAALQSLQAQNIDIPFIIVSGSIPEDTAVTLMRAGAHDYLMKYNLARLVPVVERELREAQERRQRCQAEESLQANEERFQALIENALDIIVVLNLEGILEYVSPSIERILGYKPIDSIGKNAFNSIHPDDASTVQEVLKTITDTSNQVRATEVRFKHQDDSWRILEVVYQRYVESDGIGRVVVNARDISDRKRMEADRKQAEAALAQSEAQYRFLFENNPHPMWIVDTETFAFLAVNDAAILKYGYSRTEFLAMTIFDIRPVEDIESLRNSFAQAESALYTAEWRHRKKNGEIFDVEINSHPILWENKSARFVFAKDISDRKRTEAKLQQLNQSLDRKVQERTQELERSEALLREREQAFRALAENTPDIVARFDHNLRHLYVSPSVQSVTGLAVEYFIGKTNAELGMPDHLLNRWADILQSVFANGQPTETEFNFPTVDGVRYYQSKIVPEFAPDGSIRSVLTTARDITTLKQTQEALQNSENRLSLALGSANAGLWDWDLKTNQGFWSDQNFRLLGHEPLSCEVNLENWLASIHPEDREQALSGITRVLNGETILNWEYRVLLPDGSIRWIYTSGKALFDEQGNPKAMTGIQIDISDRKQAEIALQQKVQREQLLRAITQRVRQSLDLDAILETAVREVRQTLAADRVLIFQLLSDSRGQVIKEAVSPQFPSLSEGQWTDTCLLPSNMKQNYTGQPRIVLDVTLDEWGACLGEFLQQMGVKSKISAPIIQHLEDGSTQTWGLFIVHACAQQRIWQSDEAEFLQQLSNQLAIAIQQSNLYQRVQIELEERQKIEDQLRASLEEKEVLLREVHHRVKNNLQMVSSLLNLQANTIDNPEALKLFVESQQRVKTMALIHEKLYQSDNLAKINFAEYVQSLMEELYRSYQTTRCNISFCLEVAPVELAVDVVIPCGLIINELISNALKYAFPTDYPGEIKILFAPTAAQQHTLTVSDNGIGIPENVDFRQSSSLGLQLVCALTQKLRGTIKLDRIHGTTFNITF